MSTVIRTATVTAVTALLAAGGVAVVTAGPAASAVPPGTTTTASTTASTTSAPATTTTTTTLRTTSSSRTSFCDPAPPDATLQSATETSLTFTYTSHGDYCGDTGTTQLRLYTEIENWSTPAGEGGGSGKTGTLTISGLTPGTTYYYVTSGGGSPFSSGFKGPVSTAGTPTPPVCPAATNASLAIGRLAVPEGWRNVSVAALNDAGTVLGNAISPTGIAHAVTWSATGAFTDLGLLPGGTYANATKINASGAAIGYVGTADGPGRAVLWHRGRITVLNGPDGGSASAVAIADDGSVVGNWYDTSSATHALRWDTAGRPALLATLPGAGGSQVYQGNGAGQVAGASATTSEPFGDYHVVLWERSGRFTDLEAAAGAPRLYPSVLSDTGTVGEYTGLMWSRARGFRQLPVPAGVGSVNLSDINAGGGVLGYGIGGSGPYPIQAYRWSASGTAQVLPYLEGRERGSVIALNDSGVAIGSTSLFNAVPHGTRWGRSGVAEDLGGVTSCDRSEPVAINKNGVIAGTIRLAGAASTANIPVVWRPVTR